MKRRHLIGAACIAAAAASVPAFAADYPTKPIKLVIPYPPGGTSDILGRVLGQRLTEVLGQSVVIDNKPGAAEAVGASLTAKAPADGYTLMLATLSSLAVNPSLYGRTLPYDPNKDFVPIVHIANVPAVMVTNPAVPVHSMTELQAYLKKNPDRSYASPGLGAPGHLGVELYKKSAGVSAVHIPYKGGAPALLDVVSGQVDFMLALVPEAMPFAKTGKLRALAISSPQRSTLYPDLPTISESSMKGFEIALWYTLVAPAATPPDVVRKLNQAVNSVLNEKAIKDRLAEMSINPAGGTPEVAATLMLNEQRKWKKVIEEGGIKPE